MMVLLLAENVGSRVEEGAGCLRVLVAWHASTRSVSRIGIEWLLLLLNLLEFCVTSGFLS